MILDNDIVSTPEHALQRLLAGNQRFVANQTLAPRRQIEDIKPFRISQAPFAAFLGCADSRVPVEIIFDQGFGDLFVTRVAGNVASAEIVGSLEFAAEILKVKLVFVLAHTSCGAVTATIEGNDVPGLISSIFHRIKPAARTAANNIEETIVENARCQAELIAETSPVIKQKIRQGLLKVVAGIYNLNTGRVEMVEL